MDCNKANEYMMGFMDKKLPKSDMKKLNEHLNNCMACKEDFFVYNEIMTEFADIELLCAPDDLEAKVMARIEEQLGEQFASEGLASEGLGSEGLALAKDSIMNTMDNLIYWCLGIFSVLTGASFIATLYKDRIIEYLYSTPKLSVLADFYLALSDYAARFSANLTQLTTDFITSFAGYFSYARYGLIAILVVLGVAQFILYRRDKVET